MTELRRRMYEDLQLAGYSPNTQESYIITVQVLAKYYKRSPDLLTENEIRQFFLYLINERKVSSSSITVYLSSLSCSGAYPDLADHKPTPAISAPQSGQVPLLILSVTMA
jgi:hypothetical protein